MTPVIVVRITVFRKHQQTCINSNNLPMIRKCLFSTTILLFSLSTLCFGQHQTLRLWYDKPAQHWEETLPLGNGRLGMMPDGGVNKERIVLNDITLWSGAPQDANNYEAYKYLPLIRKL